MTHTITLDDANLAGPRGLEAGQAAALDRRVRELRARMEAERGQGLHGYLRTPADAASLEAILRLAQPRMGRFDHLVVLGVGGSSLGLKTLAAALAGPGPILHIVDNTDPALFAATAGQVNLARTLFVAVSKSGGTLETVAALGYFAGLLRQAGLALRDQMIAVTDPERGPLREFADKHGLDTAEIPPEVGGRFSVLTAAGLLPAALLNIDVGALCEGAARSLTRDWPARLGLAAMESGRSQIVFMPYGSRLGPLADWFVQLWDESLGKDGKGQTAIRAVGASDQHSQLQLFLEGPDDKLVVFVRVEKHRPDVALDDFEWDEFDAGYLQGWTLGEVINAQQAGTARALAERHRPNATLSLPELDAATVGELLMGLMMATTYAAMALGVNAYDQPAVEAGKKISRGMLED